MRKIFTPCFFLKNYIWYKELANASNKNFLPCRECEECVIGKIQYQGVYNNNNNSIADILATRWCRSIRATI